MQLEYDTLVPFDYSWHLAWRRSTEEREIRRVAPCVEFRRCSAATQHVGRMLWQEWLFIKGDEKHLYEPDQIGLDGTSLAVAAAAVFQLAQRQTPTPIVRPNSKSLLELKRAELPISLGGFRTAMHELESAGLVRRSETGLWLVRFGATFAAGAARSRGVSLERCGRSGAESVRRSKHETLAWNRCEGVRSVDEGCSLGT